MRKNIFFRILCLLLCISMVAPTVVDATTQTPLYTYPSVTVQTSDGETTKKMAYVDQFFDDDGDYSDLGDRLRKWLNPDPREEGADRTNSGYLMLEQEMMHQSSSDAYKKKSDRVKFFSTALETVSSGGTNLIVDMISDQNFKDQFPNAGEDAYIYYLQLLDILSAYSEEVQEKLVQAESAWNTTCDAIDNLTEITPEAIDGVNLVCGRVKEVDTWVFAFSGTGKRANFTVLDCIDGENGLELVVEAAGGGTETISLTETIKKYANNASVTFDIKPTSRYTSLRQEISDKIAEEVDALNGKKLKSLDGRMETKHVKGLLNAAADVDGSGNVKKAFKESADCLDEIDGSAIKTPDFDKLGYATTAIGTVVGIANAASSHQNATARQAAYLNTLSKVSLEYLDMLSRWKAMVAKQENQEAIQDAIFAVWVKIFELQGAGEDKIMNMASSDAADFGSRSDFAEVFFDFGKDALGHVLDYMTKARQASDSLKIVESGNKLADITNTVGNVGAIAGFLSMGFDAATADFSDFEKNSNAIAETKRSLYVLLTDSNTGLLEQYRKHRTHETACAIINALELMKTAKIMGENLWEEYYLMDLYDEMDLEISGKVHRVLRNELMLRTGTEKINATSSFVPVIAVYEDNVTYMPQNENSAGESLNRYRIETEFLGYYLQKGSDTADYKGKALQAYTSMFQTKLPGVPEYDGLVEQSVTDNTGWTSNRTAAGYDISKVWIDDQKMYYSKNGTEIFMTREEYRDYLQLEASVNRLLATYGGANEVFWKNWEEEEHSASEKKVVTAEQQLQRRLEWTNITRRWIESFKMFDPNGNYPVY